MRTVCQACAGDAADAAREAGLRGAEAAAAAGRQLLVERRWLLLLLLLLPLLRDLRLQLLQGRLLLLRGGGRRSRRPARGGPQTAAAAGLQVAAQRGGHAGLCSVTALGRGRLQRKTQHDLSKCKASTSSASLHVSELP